MFRKDKDMVATGNNSCYYIEEFRELGIEALYTGVNFPYKEFERDKNIYHGYQTHSKNVQVVRGKLTFEVVGAEQDLERETSQEKTYYPFQETHYPDCDGLVTDRKDVVLFTKHADCLAIYFYDRKREVVGLCHSGWKGSYQKIAIEILEKMRDEYGSELKDIIIGIGIGISPENYEVSEDFYESFKNKYSDKVLEGVFLREEIFHENIRIYFDNERFNYNLLLDYGVPKENMILSELCTFNDKTLHSHRRDREKAGRNRAYIYWHQ